MSNRRVEEERTRWEEKVLDPLLAKRGETRESFGTHAGIPIERVYQPGEGSEEHFCERIGYPGQMPLTRGVQPTMYRGRLWTMRQYAGFGSAEESNQRYRYLLEQGQTGLSVAFDLPTQMGRDPDHALAIGEVGKVGVSISSLRDMEVLFDQIPLEKVSTSMTINSTAVVLLCMYIALAEAQGADPKKLRGTIQNDVLKEYVARGTYIFPPKESMRLVTDIFAYCNSNVPKWNTISISGYHIREAGSDAVQEVAFTLADGIAYVEAALGQGLAIDAFGPRLSFFFNVHNNFLEEIAKFRAARRLWARTMRDRFGAKDVRSMSLRFHTQTAGCTLTAQQPKNNIVRVALQALASVFGGTQSLHTNSWDEALCLPTEDAVTIALRTQQLIGYESGVTDTVDPFGGSYAIEALTDQIEDRAQEYIDKIDALGGMVRAIEEGFVQKEIQDASYRYQLEVESASRVIVGVNRFVEEEDRNDDLLSVDPELGARRAEELRKLRQERDNGVVSATLAALEEGAKGDANLVPLILDSVRAYATLGEITDVLRGVFTEYRPRVVL